MSWPLLLSHPSKEGVVNLSKWLQHQVLLDKEEMRALFNELSPVMIYCASEPVTAAQAVIEVEEFLEKYDAYIDALKSGKVLEDRSMRRFFSAVLTVAPECLYAMQIAPEKYLIKMRKPVIQMQAHSFYHSTVDGKYHSMVLSNDSISWGIQFSYPQIFQDPKTRLCIKVENNGDFPNTALFMRLAKWIRHHTLPTPLVYNGSKTFVPMRIGKQCLNWIHQHPQLQAKGLSVEFER